MATIFVILLIFGIFHFIYESILSPTFRLKFRYKLFELRDELRNIKSEENEKISDEVFYLLEATICTVINRLFSFNISTQIDARKEYKNNKAFQKRVEKSKKIIEECKDERIHKINQKAIKIAFIAFIINSGGWFYVLVPFVLFMLIIAFITQSIKKVKGIITKEIYKVAYASDNDFSHFPNVILHN